MQYALPSHVCREFGHTAPNRGAFWLIQMLGTRPSAERDPNRLKPFFSNSHSGCCVAMASPSSKVSGVRSSESISLRATSGSRFT